MTGVPRELAEHALQIIPGSKLVRQAMRRFRDEKRRAIAKEISKLLKAGFIKEVIHIKWVANPMLVPKKNTKVLRMCVDYTGLNKARGQSVFWRKMSVSPVDEKSICIKSNGVTILKTRPLGNVKIIFSGNSPSYSALSYQISGRDSFKGGRSVTSHFL
jgi:hypothetical protein